MKQMIWQYLPRDLLHCLYSEWLTWSDLSALDIACLRNEARIEWLSSLSYLVKAKACSRTIAEYDHVPGDKLVNYYEWLGSHKVLVRDDFPVRLSVLEDLLRCCDPVTFCPALHSILILDESRDTVWYDASKTEACLSCFFNHCTHLQEVKVRDWRRLPQECAQRDDIVFTSLNKQLRDNQLVKLIHNFEHSVHEVNFKISDLLLKHANSLKELRVWDYTAECSGIVHVLENLIKSKHHLRELDIRSIIKRDNSTLTPLLLQYLNSAGTFLESLNLQYAGDNASLATELWILIGRSCPNLERLSWSIDVVNGYPNPIEMYQQCPKLKSISVDGLIVIDVLDDKNELFMDFISDRCFESFEDYIECLLLAWQRGKYSQVGLFGLFSTLEDNKWSLMKSKVGSFLTSLKAGVTEEVLIGLLRGLPRLQNLSVSVRGKSTNCSLSALAEYGQNLTQLCISNIEDCEYTEEKICEMIRSCNMLEELAISGAGRESILCAAQSLPKLKIVRFGDVKVSMAEVVSLLCCEEVRWPCCLLVGEVRGDGFMLTYDTSSRSWSEY